MTWQKDLKILKKQPVADNMKSVDKPQIVKQKKVEEISFKEYCNTLEIKPFVQNTVTFKPNKQPKKVVYTADLIYDFTPVEFFAEEESKREFYRFGQKNLPRDLRNDKHLINAVLDLHNYTKNHALTLLDNFIKTNFGKCLKVIHGQGLNSNNNKPILIGLVRKYLEYCPQIIAYTYGSPSQGGNGVTILKLKA